MVRLLLVFLLLFSLSNSSYGQECESVPQVLDTIDFTLKKSCSPYTIDKSLVVGEGRTLTVEDDVVINENGEPTNLMENIPIEIEHIEDLMNSK